MFTAREVVTAGTFRFFGFGFAGRDDTGGKNDFETRDQIGETENQEAHVCVLCTDPANSFMPSRRSQGADAPELRCQVNRKFEEIVASKQQALSVSERLFLTYVLDLDQKDINKDKRTTKQTKRIDVDFFQQEEKGLEKLSIEFFLRIRSYNLPSSVPTVTMGTRGGSSGFRPYSARLVTKAGSAQRGNRFSLVLHWRVESRLIAVLKNISLL